MTKILHQEGKPKQTLAVASKFVESLREKLEIEVDISYNDFSDFYATNTLTDY